MSVFKAYDIRGVYPGELNEALAYKIGRACASFFKSTTIIVGKDNRLSSPQLAHALIQGIRDEGTNVVDIGLCTTPMIYFAAQQHDAIMVTASHNPQEFNGFKICRKGSQVVGKKEGITDISRLINKKFRKKKSGRLQHKDIMETYVKHVLSFKEKIARFNIVVDAGNGMAGMTFPKVFKNISCVIHPLYFTLDGRYPNHVPNPILPENIKDAQKEVKKKGAHLGILFDGDVDRVVFLDEKGRQIMPDVIGAMIADHLIKEHPGAKILCEVTCSKIIDDVSDNIIRSKVGHTNISVKMQKYDALFGFERSGHYYFKDNFSTDSAMIAAITVLNIFSQYHTTFSALIKKYQKYASIQYNLQVKDKKKAVIKIQKKYAKFKQSKLDGITIEKKDSWFNVRPSNTEPLIRITVEASSEKKRDSLLREVIKVVG